MSYAIRVENLGKRYELGATHAGSVRELVNRAWSRVIGRNDAPVTVASLDPEAGERVEGNAFWALRDVSFEVKPGEVVGIIGRNGSGKSTLLKILSQITAPTTGRVELHGRVASLLEVGTGFHPELSGRENIYLNGAILGMSKLEIRRKFDEIVAFAEIEKFIDTPVKRYSSGMYVRLAFAVAAHLEPEILVVDEVLAVGDAEFQRKCLGKMGEVARGGRAVLFVSHNMQAVTRLTSSVVLLEKGLVQFRGPTLDGVAQNTAQSLKKRVVGQPYNAPSGKSGYYVDAVRVETSEGLGEHICNRPIAFEFDIRVDNVIRDGVCFSFQVCDDGGRPVCHFWLLDRSADFQSESGLYRCRCVIPRFRLYMGNYTLNTFLTDRRGGNMLESLTELCQFEVTMRGIFRDQYDWALGAMVYWEEFQWAAITKPDQNPCVK